MKTTVRCQGRWVIQKICLQQQRKHVPKKKHVQKWGGNFLASIWCSSSSQTWACISIPLKLCFLGCTPRVCDSVGLFSGPRVYFSKSFQVVLMLQIRNFVRTPPLGQNFSIDWFFLVNLKHGALTTWMAREFPSNYQDYIWLIPPLLFLKLWGLNRLSPTLVLHGLHESVPFLKILVSGTWVLSPDFLM